jgi:UDP-N-acetyl-2-amino-2-deoxyglucuronate dehydrogenase
MRAAIIGCGVIGPVHAAALAQDRRVELAWACDLDLARARSLGAARSTVAAAEVFADPTVDLVCICTPHPSHSDFALAALAAGKHVVIEKPLGSEPAAVAGLVAADDGRRVVAGIFQHRFAPLNRRLAELCAQGAFGRIGEASLLFRCTRDAAYYGSAAWRGSWEHEGGGVLINQAIHFVDLMLWFAGAPRAVVTATVDRRLPCLEAEDSCQATLRLEGGAQARIDVSNDHSTDWLARISVRGSVGGFTIDANDRLAAIDHPSAALAAELQALSALTFSSLPGAKPCYGPLHALQLQDTVDAIHAGRAPRVRVADAAMTNAAVLGIYHAAATGEPTILPLAGGAYHQPRHHTRLQESRS